MEADGYRRTVVTMALRAMCGILAAACTAGTNDKATSDVASLPAVSKLAKNAPARIPGHTR